MGTVTEKSELLKALDVLKAQRFVDLTHSFDSEIPHYSGFQPEQRTVIYDYEPGTGRDGHGFLAHEYRLVGQWGTHVDPPAHFAKGGRFQDQIDVADMVLPLVVLNISARVSDNANSVVTMADVNEWERRYGTIPEHSFVALYTGWSQLWPDHDRMMNYAEDGTGQWPGWSLEVLQFLVNERHVAAVGHDTTDTDPGQVVGRGTAPLETYVAESDIYQIEMLANLEQVAPSGAIIFATWPKVKNGSGFPARVFAVTPDSEIQID